MIKTNEVLLKENNEWLHFSDPYHVFSVQRIDGILPALKEIERLIAIRGWYAAGFLSYEAAPAFDSAFPASPHPETGFPLLWFGLYPQPRSLSRIGALSHSIEGSNWQPSIARDSYDSAIEKIKNHIAHGRTYQVNYTLRLQTEFTGDEWNFFLHLAQSQNNHAAYIDTGRFVICSASPELFFQLDGDTITCRPMKGTVKRGRTTLEDHRLSDWLRNSEKNRAENVMIVDMIRNDLGRITQIGSVRVPELFTVEKYPTLWQMTSTICARTQASVTEIFTALFPCASITGAPKISTTKIIADLETTPRRIYTGSIGHIAPNRTAKFNVAIRTALIDRQTQKAEYGVGSGIVWDSSSVDEYAETLLKARVLTDDPPQFSLFETMLWTPEAGIFLREKHIARLLDSADYFDFRVSKEAIEETLDGMARNFAMPQRIRLLVDGSGEIKIESKPHQPAVTPIRTCLSDKPIDSKDVFLFHKTTQRQVYNEARKRHPRYDDVLLHNENGELTEFTIGNLVVRLEGKLFTPPISCGLLAGTYRAHLLETSQVEERTVRIEELKNCTAIFRVNSIRGRQEVGLES